jgi:hypothetical protein
VWGERKEEECLRLLQCRRLACAKILNFKDADIVSFHVALASNFVRGLDFVASIDQHRGTPHRHREDTHGACPPRYVCITFSVDSRRLRFFSTTDTPASRSITNTGQVLFSWRSGGTNTIMPTCFTPGKTPALLPSLR